MALQLRRGTNQQRLGLTPVEGEMIYITDSVLVSISVDSINTTTETLSTTAPHNLSINQQVKYIGNTLNGLTKNQVYFVKTAPTITSFTLSTTLGGGTLNITGTYTVPLVFAISPTNFAGQPIGYTESALWAGDGVTVGGLAVGITNLDALNDIVITQPVNEGQFLWYDGTNWINTNEPSVDTKLETLKLIRRYTTIVEPYESNIALRLTGRVTDAVNDNTDDAGPALRFERASGTQYTKTYVSGGAIGAFTITLNNVTNLVVGNKVTGTGLPDGNGALITLIAGNQLTLDTAFTVQAAGTYTIGESVGFGQLAFEYRGTTDIHKFVVSTSTDNYLESPVNVYPGTYTLIESTKDYTNINQGRLYVDELNDRVGINTITPTTGLDINGGLFQATSSSTGRPVFQYNNTTAGTSSIIRMRKHFGATGYTTGDGAGLAFQIDDITQSPNQIAIIDATYDATVSPNKNSVVRLRTNTIDDDGSAGSFTTVGSFSPILATLPGDLNVNSGVLFVDASTNRVGINNITPNFELDVSGNAYISGNLTVAGGNITTSAGTGNLFNTSATTVNIGNAATTEVNVGCPTGGSRVFIKAPILDVSGTANITTALTTPSITTVSSADLLISPNTGGDLKLQTNLAPDPVIANRITANTNASTRTLVTRVESTGTPAVGLGNLISMETETQPNIFGIGGYLETISTAATAGVLNAFKMNFGVMNTVAGVTTVVPRMTLEGNGDLQIDGDLEVTGGDIDRTTSGQANIFNVNANDINIGNSAGTTRIGAPGVGNTVLIKPGILVGEGTTQNVFNTVATTVNAFGATTTALNLGNISGVTTVAGRLKGALTLETPNTDTVTSGNISIGTAITLFTTPAVNTCTLPNGNNGQFKTLVRTGAANSMTVTVTTAGWKFGASGTISFGDRGDSCFLQYIDGWGWTVLGDGASPQQPVFS